MKTPREYQDMRDQFVALHSRALEQLEEILARKPQIWMALRDTSKSSAEADKKWEATQDGIAEMRLKIQVKRLEKEISTAASALRLLESEGRNQF